MQGLSHQETFKQCVCVNIIVYVQL